MCWNSTVSINTFLITLFSITLAYFNKTADSKLLFYIFAFSLIQLLEYFLWTNQKSVNLNNILSNIGLLILVLECYASINLIQSTNIRYYACIVFSLLLFVGLFLHDYKSANTTIGINKHLQWNWVSYQTLCTIIYLLFFIGSSFFWSKELNIIKIFSIGSLVTASIWAYVAGGGMGTLWCWIANFISLYLLYGTVVGCI